MCKASPACFLLGVQRLFSYSLLGFKGEGDRIDTLIWTTAILRGPSHGPYRHPNHHMDHVDIVRFGLFELTTFTWRPRWMDPSGLPLDPPGVTQTQPNPNTQSLLRLVTINQNYPKLSVAGDSAWA